MAYLIEKSFSNCSPVPNSDVRCVSTWNLSGVVLPNALKVEHKIRLPNYQEFSFFSEPTAVWSWESEKTFQTASFMTPIPAGQYDFIWAVLYYSGGTTIAEG